MLQACAQSLHCLSWINVRDPLYLFEVLDPLYLCKKVPFFLPRLMWAK